MSVQMELHKIIISEMNDQQIIVLKEVDGERKFPIVIGNGEAYAIDRRLKGIATARPLTHDLLANVIDQLGGTISRIEVVTYRPIADFGCWGISFGRDGERALIARGNRGVRLVLNDGTKLLIGSQRPEALARALEQALRPGV